MAETIAPVLETKPLTEKEISALVVKHHAEIDRIQGLTSEAQVDLFRQLGVDPKMLESHYADLQHKAAELRREDEKANDKVAAVGWASLAAGAGGMTAFTHVKRPNSKLVRWLSVGFTAAGAALAGTFAASRIFAGKIRDESEQLNIDAKKIFDRELAVLLENREREGLTTTPVPLAPAKAPAQAAAPAPVAEAPAMPSAAANVSRRDASFAAQAATDKAVNIKIQVGA